MPTDACREWRGAVAAAALGRIDAADEVALQAHLDGCTQCRRELGELRAAVRALPLADPARVVEETREPPVGLAERVIERVAHEHARVRRRRLRVVLVAAAVVAAIAGIGAVAVATLDEGREPSMTITFPAVEDARGRADLFALDEGTEVELAASGLKSGDWYWLWLTNGDGDRVTAGTFKGTGDEVEVTLTAALALEDARRIWVTDGDDAVVLDAPL
jgi:anti-sigma factor RsiW